MIIVPLPDGDTLPATLRNCPHWIMWKAEQRDGKINKVPIGANGFAASMKENHRSFDDAINDARDLRKRHDCESVGVGLAFTDDIGIVGVDLDGAMRDGRREEHLEWMLGKHPTWGEISISGNGVHLFYEGHFDGKRAAIVDGRKIEIFGTKGFIAITGTVLDGCRNSLSEFEPLGVELAPHLETVYQPPPSSSTNVNGNGHANGQYRDSLSFRNWGLAALNVQCERVRMAPNGQLHYTLASASASVGRVVPHCISFEEAEEALWYAAKDAGGKDMDNARKTIRGQLEFGMLSPAWPAERFTDIAIRSNGSHAHVNGVDLSEFGTTNHDDDELDEESFEESIPSIEDPGPFPEELLNVPGLVGKVVEYTNANSFVRQPILALAGAIALMSTLTGRKIQDKNGVRTNLYILSLAASGEGKDAARKTNKRILYDAGADDLVGPESWASGPGLLAALESQPCSLFQNDEIGRFLQTTNDPNKSPYLYSIVSILLKLYSSSGDVFLGDVYADGRRKTIQQPHAVLYGTTVPSSLFKSITESSVMDGMLSRLIVFVAPAEQQPLQDPEMLPPPSSVIEAVRDWHNWHPGAGSLRSVHPTPHTVTSNADAERVFRELRDFSRSQQAVVGDVLGSLWVRAVENARKLALLYACSEKFGEGSMIGEAAASWACTLSSYLVRRLCFSISRHVYANAVEGNHMIIRRLIEESGENGITGKSLLRRTGKMNRKERSDALDYLIECGYIKRSVRRNGRGRPTTVYHL